MEPWTDLETVSSAWKADTLTFVLSRQKMVPAEGSTPQSLSGVVFWVPSVCFPPCWVIYMIIILKSVGWHHEFEYLNGSCDCIRNNMWVITGSWLRIELKSSQWVVLTLNYQLTVTCLTSRPHTNLKWSFWVVLPNRLPTYKDGTLTAELQKDKNSFKDQILFHLKDDNIISKIFIWVN